MSAASCPRCGTHIADDAQVVDSPHGIIVVVPHPTRVQRRTCICTAFTYTLTSAVAAVAQPATDRWSLVDADQIIDDCGFRMLEPYEIAAAMAFPTGYIPRDLTKKDQVKLAGNAVTPPVMTWIAGRIAQAIEAAA